MAHTAFQAAFIKLVEQAGEVASHFGQRGHRNKMSDVEVQLLDRVSEFLEAVDRDRGEQCCDGCGRGTAKIGAACSHCGEIIECAVN